MPNNILYEKTIRSCYVGTLLHNIISTENISDWW
jgi:hypothetical protein